MSFPEAVFKIIQEVKCPLYELGDTFKLSGKALLLKHMQENTFVTTAVIEFPYEKPECRILVADITGVLIKYERMESAPEFEFNCSGCTGMIRLSHKKTRRGAASISAKNANDNLAIMSSLLNHFSIFQALTDHEIKRLIPILKLKKYKAGQTILRKGEPGRNLYIIMSGRVEVIGKAGEKIAILGRGEVFGEMSLISGDPVGATIRVLDPVRIIRIKGPDFRRVLNTIPSLQMYFTRLLARRLQRRNLDWSEEFSSGMTGKLSEMVPSDLFQTLNANQKTGTLTLKVPDGDAMLAFRDGLLIKARYNDIEGEEAFFHLLKCREGRFNFIAGLSPDLMDASEIGDFMWLLMEGLNRIDEENALKHNSP